MPFKCFLLGLNPLLERHHLDHDETGHDSLFLFKVSRQARLLTFKEPIVQSLYLLDGVVAELGREFQPRILRGVFHQRVEGGLDLVSTIGQRCRCCFYLRGHRLPALNGLLGSRDGAVYALQVLVQFLLLLLQFHASQDNVISLLALLPLYHPCFPGKPYFLPADNP